MMENIKTPSIQDVSHLERQFREKLYQLQNNTDALPMTQRELLETRHILYSTKLQLEKEQRVSHELRMQLKTAMDAVSKLEQQRAKNQLESIQLQVKYDAMSKQYDSLMNQAASTKVQETEYKMKIQTLGETLCQSDTINKRLEQTLKEFERYSWHTINTIDRNIAKLAQEHQYLTKSCEAIVSLNQRLQTVGLCTYVTHQKDTIEINNLKHMLASQLQVRDKSSANNEV